MADERTEAWAAVDRVLPLRWTTTRPTYYPDRSYWIVTAIAPTADRTGLGYLHAVGPTEPRAIRELARAEVAKLTTCARRGAKRSVTQ